tara:strand:+ start:814 stop:1062 length:249 start_codon:yes stop_codon:yes gene_type:complete
MTLTDFHPIIETIEKAYKIPHLNATRRITALLPHNYYETDKHYPVLYLQDGQNFFNPMAKLAVKGGADIIIIAINHGEEERI